MPRRRTHVAATSVVVVLTCVSVALAMTALTGSASASPSAPTPPWLQRVNDVRVAAGVAAVTENSAWTTGIQHHLTYLELTPASYRTGQYASAHTENPASPYYTADGALEGSRSNLVRNASQTATSAVDYWFGAPFHAIGMLRAGLQQTAFAQDSTYAGMDVISGYSSSVRAASPILFPGPGSTSYLTRYAGNESPDPIETCRNAHPGADYSAPGLPLIALLPAAPASNLSATLTTPSGVVLSSASADLCVVDENTYFSSDTVYGPTGQQILSGDHAVLLVPRTRLVAGTYAARISQSRQADIAWSFAVDPGDAGSPSPSAEPPKVSVGEVTCSYGTRATGAVTLSVANPAEGAGAASYAVAVGVRTTSTAAIEDGSIGSVTVSGVPGGSRDGSVSGSDGTSAVFSFEVPTCPRYQGVRVAIRKVARHRLRVRLDNSRNSATTRFRLVLGPDTARRSVPGAEVRKISAPLRRVTRVRVYVGQHLVARERLRP